MTPDAQSLPVFEALAHVHGAPEARARFKVLPEDFRVDEVLGFEPDGQGEHLLLHVEKKQLTTTDLAAQLARFFGVPIRDIGYAGMKDKQGVCSQWFSIRQPLTRQVDTSPLQSGTLSVREVRRNSRKIRIGSHQGNRFVIRLRDVRDPGGEITTRLQRLAREGVPNYFGPQRFGIGGANISRAMVMLGADALARSASGPRSMLYSALRAALFNLVTSERVRLGSWNQGLAGEVYNLDGTRRFFVPGEADSETSKALGQRLDGLDIHPTGPLAGAYSPKDLYQPGATVKRLEQDCLAPWQAQLASLAANQVMAGRRPLRAAVRDLQHHWSGPGELSLSFTLGTGTYATSVLREICLVEAPDPASAESNGERVPLANES